MSITTDYLISLADMDEDSLYILYKEALTSLKSKDLSIKDRKMYTLRVMMIRSIISDKYSLRFRHSTPSLDNPMENPQINRFYK